MSPDKDINPYQAPAVDAYLVPQQIDDPLEQWQRKVKRFRQQMQGLGGLWLCQGLLLLSALVPVIMAAAVVPELFLTIGILGFLGLVWSLIAWATLVKSTGGVVAGCVLTLSTDLIVVSLAAVYDLAWIMLFMIYGPITLGAIWQGLRVLRWAREMRAAGIPLDVRPKDVGEWLQPIEFVRIEPSDR